MICRICREHLHCIFANDQEISYAIRFHFYTVVSVLLAHEAPVHSINLLLYTLTLFTACCWHVYGVLVVYKGMVVM